MDNETEHNAPIGGPKHVDGTISANGAHGPATAASKPLAMEPALTASTPSATSASASASNAQTAVQNNVADKEKKPFAHMGTVLFFIALALFAVASAVRIYLATFPKTIDVMPDELRYLDLARSLFNNGSLTIRGDAATFQKILYPLSLMPAMIFSDTLTQIKAVGVLNSLYVCSAVFPALLIAKRLFKKPSIIIACMVLTLILPDMCFSMTFMSEVVFIPIALWLTYLLWAALTATGTRRNLLSLAGGALCYATYLAKEVALGFAIAFVLLYLIFLIRKTEDRRECIMAIGCFLIGFLGPFIILKLTLFAGMGNSYSQSGPDILLSAYTVLFGLYALGTDAVYFIVGFAFFPIFFAVFTYRDLSRADKRLLVFCLISLVVGLLTVVYTISMREDVGHVALRQHLRYVIPLYLPLLFLFIKQITHADTEALKRSPKRLAIYVGTVVGVCMLVATMFGSANLSQGFDNSQFHVFREITALFQPIAQQYYDGGFSTLTNISTKDGTLLAINPADWIERALVIAFIAGGSIALLGKRRVLSGKIICGIITAAMLANTVYAYQYNMKAYPYNENEISEVCAIDSYLSQLPTPTEVLIVNDTERTGMNNLTDTYIDNRHLSYRYITDNNLAAYLSDTGVLDQKGVLYRTSSSLNDTDFYQPEMPHIEYVLVNSKQKIRFLSGNVQLVDVGDSYNFMLYRITDNQPVALVDEN